MTAASTTKPAAAKAPQDRKPRAPRKTPGQVAAELAAADQAGTENGLSQDLAPAAPTLIDIGEVPSEATYEVVPLFTGLVEDVVRDAKGEVVLDASGAPVLTKVSKVFNAQIPKGPALGLKVMGVYRRGRVDARLVYGVTVEILDECLPEETREVFDALEDEKHADAITARLMELVMARANVMVGN